MRRTSEQRHRVGEALKVGLFFVLFLYIIAAFIKSDVLTD